MIHWIPSKVQYTEEMPWQDKILGRQWRRLAFRSPTSGWRTCSTEVLIIENRHWAASQSKQRCTIAGKAQWGAMRPKRWSSTLWQRAECWREQHTLSGKTIVCRIWVVLELPNGNEWEALEKAASTGKPTRHFAGEQRTEEDIPNESNIKRKESDKLENTTE